MYIIVVSSEGVIKLLKGLNPSKALGPDELHPRVLKELANELLSFQHYSEIRFLPGVLF